MTSPRIVLAASSLAIIVAVVAVAIALGPHDARFWLLVSGGLAAITGVQSIASDPRDLGMALLFSLPPVIALIADGSPTWLVAPLGAMLLVAGELNGLSWECQGAPELTAVQRRRLLNAGVLGMIGLAGALSVWLVTVAS